MKALLPQSWHELEVFIGGLVAVGTGLADRWHFHGWPDAADTVFLIGGLAVLGVNLAFAAGQTVASSSKA